MLTSLVFLAFAAFLFASNSFDWGYFYSTGEIDRRSWLNDGQPPLWSYQLCAGSSRLGDPQAFGLSPLFFLSILFGPILGLKALVWFCALVGYLALRSIGLMVAENFGGTSDKSVVGFLALATVFGNYFLWHLHVGHATFALMYGVFAFLYFLLKACLDKFGPRHAAIVGLMSFAYFSAGFSSSLIYLFLPLTISLLPALIVYAPELKLRWVPLARFVIAMGLGIMCAFFKIFGVMNYQGLFPRTLPPGQETFSFFEFLRALVVPTFWSLYLVGEASGPWGIWEYSSFHFTLFILVAAAVALVIKRRSRPTLSPAGKFLSVWILSLFLLAVSLLLPNDQPLSLVYWTNLLLNNSVRVFIRFQVLWLLLIFLAAAATVSYLEVSGRQRRFLWLVLAPLLMLNFFSFKSLKFSDAMRALYVESRQPVRMNQLAWVPNHPLMVAVMYPAIKAGFIVPNCYQPINRKTPLLPVLEGEIAADPSRNIFPLVAETENAACRENSDVKQNEIILDPTCAPGTCLNINDVNMYAPPENLVFDVSKRRWCIGERSE